MSKSHRNKAGRGDEGRGEKGRGNKAPPGLVSAFSSSSSTSSDELILPAPREVAALGWNPRWPMAPGSPVSALQSPAHPRPTS